MNPLASVVVATYNSSPFILEALGSVINQTWKPIELIITDDCSEDDTIEVCRKWLNENDQRFSYSKILTFEKNTGISANANRGLHAAKGDWIKFLGADDTLKSNCIEDNIAWIDSHPEIKVLFSRIEIYRNTFELQNLIGTVPGKPYNSKGILASNRNANSQYKMLLISDRIHFTPSAFLHRETLLAVGGFDERFKLQEDYPLWLNLTKNGHKLHFMDKITVNYRRHSAAIYNNDIVYLIKPIFFKTEDFRKMCTYPFLPRDIRLYAHFYWFASQIFRCNWLNRNQKPNRFLLALLTSYLNPVKYYIYLKKHFKKNLKDDEFYT